MRRILMLARKELIQIARDKRLLPLIFVVPVIQVVLFGYVVQTEVKNIPMLLVDHDKTAQSRTLTAGFTNAGYFDITGRTDDEAEIAREMDAGSISFALIIPGGYEEAIKAGETADVLMVSDGSDPNTAAQAQQFASRIVGAQSGRLLTRRFNAMSGVISSVASVESRVRVWYNPDLRSVNYMVPGLIGLILTLVTMLLTSTAIVREKETGTLEQLIVSPIKRSELLMGKIAPYAVIGFVEVSLVIFAGTVWFGVPLRGSVLLLFLLSIVFLFTTVGQGLLVSTVSRTLHQALITSWFFMLPSMMLSGFIFPIASMPPVIQVFTYLIPLRYFLVIVRGIFLKGVGITALWDQVVILAALGAVIFSLSILAFRKTVVD